jgi:MFS family permease
MPVEKACAPVLTARSTALEPVVSSDETNRVIGWRDLFAHRNASVSLMLTGGVAIHALSLRVVTTILPSVVEEIGGLPFFAWVTTLAMVSSIWGAALASTLVNSRGLQQSYRISLILFAAGSVTCAIAPDMAIMLVGRLLQGFGGGLLTALAYATIRRVFSGVLRTRAIVLVSGIWGIAALCGPLLGGILAGWGLWRWAFWLDLPVAVAVWMMAERALPASRSASDANAGLESNQILIRLLLLGAAVLAVAIGGVSGSTVWSCSGFVVGVILMTMLLRREGRSGVTPFRLIPSGAYQPKNVVGSISLVMAIMAGSSAAVIFLPYVATNVDGYPPIIGGYLSAILALSWTTAAFISASANPTWERRSIYAGSVLIMLGMAFSCWSLVYGSLLSIAVSLVPVGGGIGIAWAHLGNLMMSHARPAERDVSSAFISTNQMIALAFGSAFAGTIANLAGFADPTLGPSAVVQSVAWVFVSFSILSAAAVPLAMIAVRQAGALPSADN